MVWAPGGRGIGGRQRRQTSSSAKPEVGACFPSPLFPFPLSLAVRKLRGRVDHIEAQ